VNDFSIILHFALYASVDKRLSEAIMKLVVVTAMVDPLDPQGKRRPAVVLGMVNGRVAVAPCSTNPMRSGVVLRGGVLLTNLSPAYAETGLHAEKVIINVGQAALYSLDSEFVRNCRQIGMLDLELDKHVRDNLLDTMRTYDIAHSARMYDQPARDTSRRMPRKSNVYSMNKRQEQRSAQENARVVSVNATHSRAA
jgi:hypothetical protein